MRLSPVAAVIVLLVLPTAALSHGGDGVYVIARGFEAPSDATLLPDGTLVVAEGGSVTTINRAGARRAVRGFDAWGIEPARDGSVLGIDSGNAVVRRWVPGTAPVIVAGGTNRFGFAGDGGPATRALLYPQSILWSSGIQPLANGAFRFADAGNDRIREVDSSGIIRTVKAGFDAPLTLDP